MLASPRHAQPHTSHSVPAALRGLAASGVTPDIPGGCNRDRVLSFGIWSETTANSLITV